jgi:phage terminase small subunit
MRGRKPLPNVVKLLRASRRPLNPHEPSIPIAAAEPPAGLTIAARRVWTEAVPELARLGIFTTIDVGRVARTCVLEALGRRFLARARRAPEQRARGALLMAAKCFELADKVWSAYGVAAPGERARLRTPPKEEDALAAFKSKHRA